LEINNYSAYYRSSLNPIKATWLLISKSEIDRGINSKQNKDPEDSNACAQPANPLSPEHFNESSNPKIFDKHRIIYRLSEFHRSGASDAPPPMELLDRYVCFGVYSQWFAATA
jgi:hypothetical protein